MRITKKRDITFTGMQLADIAGKFRELSCVDSVAIYSVPRFKTGIGQPVPVVIEGPDGSGKTFSARTLAHTYANAVGPALIVHAVYAKDYFRAWRRAIKLTKQASRMGVLVIWDRCWISEKVYGPLLRGKYPKLAGALDYLGKSFISASYAHTSYIKTLERLRARDDEPQPWQNDAYTTYRGLNGFTAVNPLDNELWELVLRRMKCP